MTTPNTIPATLVAPPGPPTTVMVTVDDLGQIPAVLVDPVDRIGHVVAGTWVSEDDAETRAGRPVYRLMKASADEGA